ncbi:MFS transporter [Actinocrinis puniceicyclus]|uniref:MFS transporter n=1 Tax=Actinocrinis puniceicyclus TaxID=977794 RepID=A0A8J8BH79_9ACTN|nr:MFS transporter [Actinocrinis puniceicyclus]MBS2966519.1 MFS transporter [Actinocrinis puniceicyclus]
MPRLLAHRQMRLYLLGDTSSNFGDYALFLAIAVWVRLLTGSVAQAGLAMFAFAAGSVLLPIAGLVADRFARRPLLIVVNLVLAALVLLLLLVHDRSQVWLVYAVMFGYGAVGSVTGPAQQALLPAIVPGELLGDANGLLQSVRGLLRLFSPVIGAGLFAWLGIVPVVVIDAATFAVAALTLLAITVNESAQKQSRTTEGDLTREPGQAADRASRGRELSAGLRFIAAAASLRQLLIAAGLTMLVLGFFETIGLAVVTQGLHHAPTYLGVLGAAQAVGTIAGGVAGGAVLKRTGSGVAVMLGLGLVAGAGVLFMARVDALAIFAGFILGAGVPVMFVATTTAVQRGTPSEVQGRVFAAFEFAVTVPQTVSIALGAALIARFDYRVLLGAVTATALIALASLAAHPAQRAIVRTQQKEEEKEQGPETVSQVSDGQDGAPNHAPALT